jgi:elongation of very long chain fatty acids protein 4
MTEVLAQAFLQFADKANVFYKDLDIQLADWFGQPIHKRSRDFRLTSQWHLTKIDQAIIVTLLYLTTITFLYAFNAVVYGAEKKKSVDSKKKKQLTLREKIDEDGYIIFFSMLLYNMGQVACCGWMVYEAIRQHQLQGLKFICNDWPGFDKRRDGMAFVTYVFYLSKIFDFLDTVFILVRRKMRQFSFLHVYHHTTIFLVYWINVNFNYEGDIYFTIVLNGTIHFIMYFYYCVRILNIPVPLFLKKLLTNLQMIQFCGMIGQACYLLYHEECTGTNRNLTIFYLFYIITMLGLFMNFSIQTYSKKKKASATDKKKTN